jgi:UDP-N-acetylmuramoyl-tripeptide--D-alanyl-D-alanine ligase
VPRVNALWNAADAVRACSGESPGGWSASGVSIDTRSLEPGDLFVALRGPNRDGHDFVAAAFARGAAAAMVDRDLADAPGPLLRVDDTLAGLGALARFARARSAARIVAVTGSVGKTGTKEALRLALGAFGPAFAPSGSLNNHWGVPLSLARLPPEVAYGVFELGMNHAGEIAVLTRLVRPHIALITTVEPAHLGFFGSVEAIADAKAEVFLGLEPGGVAVLNRDNAQYARLAAAAYAAGAAGIVDFGTDAQAAVRLVDCTLAAEDSRVSAAVGGRILRFRLNLPGRHWIINALGVLATVVAAGCDPQPAAEALAGLEVLPGRGRRHRLPWQGGDLTLIDESYNASPAAMAAALAVLGATIPAAGARRVAVLGDMLELGEAAAAFHRDLAEPLVAARVDRVFLVGHEMAALAAALPAAACGGWWRSAKAAIPPLLSFLKAGDVVTIKGSYGVRLGSIVERLLAESARFGS